MAEQDDISLKMTLDASDVESGVEKVEQSVVQLGPAADAAGEQAAAGLTEIGSAAQAAETKVEQLGQESKDAWSALSKLGDEGKAAAAALQKMEAAADSPRELQRNAALAQLAMDELHQSIERAVASGAKIDSNLGGAMASAGTKIEAANVRAAKMRDTLGDMKTRGDLAAKGMEAAAGAAGSFEGMLGQLNDTGGKNAQTFAKVGFAVVSVGAAFEMGYSQGEKLRAGLTALGFQLPDLSAKTGAVVVAIESMVRGYKEAELVESAAMVRARQIISLREQQARAEQELGQAMQRSGLVWKDANAEREAVIAKLNAAELALARVAKTEEAWTAAVKVNTPELQKLRQEAEQHGLAMEKIAPRTAAAAAESDKWTTAAKGVAAATREVSAAIKEMNTTQGESATVPIFDLAEKADGTLRTLKLISAELGNLQGVSSETTGELQKLAGGFGAVAAAANAAAGSGGEQAGAPVTVPIE